MVSSAFTARHANGKEKAPEAVALQRLYTSIIMRAKVACTLTRQLSRACRRSSSRSAETHHIYGPTWCCRTARSPLAQRLHVNAERSEPKGSVYAERRRW